MAWRVILRIFVVGLALSAAGPRALLAQRSTPVAIVVHPETNVDNLAFSELRRIFVLTQRAFDGHQSIACRSHAVPCGLRAARGGHSEASHAGRKRRRCARIMTGTAA